MPEASRTSEPVRVWGWPRESRNLLIFLTLCLGIALAVTGPADTDRPAPSLPPLRVDPNQAPAVVLACLPGLGPTLSARIVAGRANGRYGTLDDLDRRVKGIGPVTARGLAPFLRFDPPTTNAP